MGPGARAFLLALALLGAASASADTVSLAASQDNTIYGENGAVSNGAGEHMFAGATKDGFLRRALVAFDVAAAIPAGSAIQSVTLTLYMSRTRTANQTVALHAVLAAWGEGTSNAGGEEGAGAPATAGDATWTHRLYPATAWTSLGGQFDPVPSASASVGNTMTYYSWSSADMVADVQGWLDAPASNFGWIVRGNEAATKVVKRFDSSENTDASRRPALTVTFTPQQATGACCAADGSCSVVLDPGGTCGGSYQGSGTSCVPNACPQPTGACCLPTPTATCTEVTEAECLGQGGSFDGAFSTCGSVECPVVLPPFVDALPLPAVAQPVSGTPGGAASYQLAVREFTQQLHRDLPPTTVWGFGDGPTGGGYPGPTIEAAANQPVTVTWLNDLRDGSGNLRTEHYLPVDTCIDGAADQSPRTVFHLHGAHVQSAYDGYPTATLLPGQQTVYQYPNGQLPTTLWYHDHALGITRLNVLMGLAGFYLIRDAFEQGLGLPSGEYEIPLAIQDRSFRPDGSFEYPAAWEEHFFGNTTLVNGKVWPYLNVKRGKYRFRLLDGSNSRTWRLTLSSGAPFQVLGMEGGLLPAPVTQTPITLGPGERADVVVDFAPYAAGTEIILTNSAPAPFPGTAGVGVLPNVMKFVVTSQTGYTAALPSTLRPLEVLHEADATVVRDLELRKSPDLPCGGSAWLINGLHFDDVTELPVLGSTEVWRFINRSGVTHPMHMHLVMFQVLDRQAFEEVGGNVVPIGSPVPPPAHEAGWKDTVQVGPNEILRVIARFEDFTGLFPYHCHILEHEDHEMMRQFETVTTCGDGVLGIPAEECDDGNGVADDGCSPGCQIEDECQNGSDDDGDGRTDYPADPGCASASGLETSASLPCDDGLDNDGDGRTDVPDDPGCRNPGSALENPQCQDGVNNDGQPGIDFDGGASLNGGVPLDAADPQCTAAWWTSEAPPPTSPGCGIGPELVVALTLLLGLRMRSRAAGAGVAA